MEFMKSYLLIILTLVLCSVGFGQAKKKPISPKKKTVAKSSNENPIPTVEGEKYVPRFVYKDEWILFATSQIGTHYINPSQLMRMDGRIYYWEKVVPSNPGSYSSENNLNNADVSHALFRIESDCKDNLSKTTHIIFYAKDGKVIKSSYHENAKMLHVKPDSVAKKSLIKACSYKL